MLSNKFRKKKSKKGFTLVEAICAVMILAIVFVGVLNAVAFSRQMVFTNNAREKASDNAQLIADQIFTIATDYNPDDAGALDNLKTELSSTLTTSDNDGIGAITYVTAFSDDRSTLPTGYSYSVQYKIDSVSASSADITDAGGAVIGHETTQSGWNITVRCYYQRFGTGNDWDCVEVSAFASPNVIG